MRCSLNFIRQKRLLKIKRGKKKQRQRMNKEKELHCDSTHGVVSQVWCAGIVSLNFDYFFSSLFSRTTHYKVQSNCSNFFTTSFLMQFVGKNRVLKTLKRCNVLRKVSDELMTSKFSYSGQIFLV